VVTKMSPSTSPPSSENCEEVMVYVMACDGEGGQQGQRTYATDRDGAERQAQLVCNLLLQAVDCTARKKAVRRQGGEVTEGEATGG
jgi:hypothetical protein